MNCSRVFINARFSFQFSFLHLLLFSCVFIFISFLVCLEREREMGRDRSPKDPGRSSSLDEVEGMFSVCCFEISRDCSDFGSVTLPIQQGVASWSSKSGKASVENRSLSATSTAYNSINSILQFLQDLRGSSSAVGLLRIVLRSERRHH